MNKYKHVRQVTDDKSQKTNIQQHTDMICKGNCTAQVAIEGVKFIMFSLCIDLARSKTFLTQQQQLFD
jgi:hypothetical protein